MADMESDPIPQGATITFTRIGREWVWIAEDANRRSEMKLCEPCGELASTLYATMNR